MCFHLGETRLKTKTKAKGEFFENLFVDRRQSRGPRAARRAEMEKESAKEVSRSEPERERERETEPQPVSPRKLPALNLQDVEKVSQ